MSVMRTSLSLITFGFTIFQAFEKLRESGAVKGGMAARHFGVALVVLGIAMLVVGIAYHLSFMYGLRRERAQSKADGLVHAESLLPAVADTDGRGAATADGLCRNRQHAVWNRAIRLDRRQSE